MNQTIAAEPEHPRNARYAMTLIPTQVTFRGLPHADALESEIRQRAAWLEQFYAGIVRCRVLVELPHRHRHDGRHFHVRIELTVPGGAPIIVSHEPSPHGGLKDVREAAHHKGAEIEEVHRHAAVAVREAFDAARRRLEDFAREQRGAVKTHEVPAHGEVVELAGADGYGYIQTGENRIYFNRASVLGDAFDELTIGTPVAFVEERGEKGPQASTVRVLGKHHYVAP
jgi:cold shock CspA family protein